MTRYFLRLALVVLAGASCTAPPPVQVAPQSSWPTGRLPRTVLPRAYTVALRVDPAQPTFAGDVTIAVRLAQPQDHIWLHGLGLRMQRAWVTTGDGQSVAARYEQVSDDGVAKLTLPEAIGPGDAELHFVYEGELGTDPSGLFRAQEAGRWYAFSQFEATDARRCFPSFDEPSFKTPYHLSLQVPAELVAAANTSVVREERLEGGQRRLTFATTEALPTYLVAFAVGELDVVTAPAIPATDLRPRAIPLRGLAAKGKGELLSEALRVTGALLQRLEAYFGVAYPFDKLDIVAVPNFGGGAMENAGLVTFRDWYVLVDPKTAPVDQRRGMAGIIAHELAHQWFGNLVTMAWWDDLWLNEAFATWMGQRITHAWDPSYGTDVELVQDGLGAMNDDSLVSARMIRQPIETNHDIANAFDSITYRKGAAVLAMFERYLGEQAFRTALTHHMERFRFGNATAEDFVASLSAKAERPVQGAFRTFIEQPGVPRLDVRLACDEAPQLHVTQRRYLPLGSAGQSDHLWQVPMCARFPSDDGVREQCWLIDAATQTVRLDTPACPAWVLPNAAGAGYYRVAMPDQQWRAALAAVDLLSPKELLAVADSLLSGLRAGDVSLEVLTEGLRVLSKVEHYAVAERVTAALAALRDDVVPPAMQERWRALGRSFYEPMYQRLGFDRQPGDTDARQLLRQAVVRFLALEARSPVVRAEAQKRGVGHLGFGGVEPDLRAVAPDLAPVALAVALQEEGVPFFERLASGLATSTDPVWRRNALGAITAVEQPALSNRALALVLDDSVRTNEVLRLLVRQVHSETRQRVWAWMKAHFEPLTERVPLTWRGYLPLAMAGACSEGMAQELQTFFADKIQRLEGGPRNLRAAVEAIELCHAVRTRYQDEAQRLLRDSARAAR